MTLSSLKLPQGHNNIYSHSCHKKTKTIPHKPSDHILYEFDQEGGFDDRGIINAQLFLEQKLNAQVDLIDKDYIKPRAKESLLGHAQAIW